MADIFGAFGGAVNDIFGYEAAKFTAEGETAAADSYGKAAKIAGENAQISQMSTDIQETQLARKIYQTRSADMAFGASNGLKTSGSVSDILWDSLSQGSLAKTLVSTQGALNKNSFLAQQDAYQGMEAAADAAAKAADIGGIGKLIGGGMNLLKGGFAFAAMF